MPIDQRPRAGARVVSQRAPEAMTRRLEELGPDEALRLLGEVTFGRVVFTLAALPAIRVVNHVVDEGEIVIRTRRLAGVSKALEANTDLGLPDLVVAYEADLLDPTTRLGWSVVATGIATTVTDPVRLRRVDGALHPWVDSAMDVTLAVRPEIVTGMRLVSG